MAYNPKIHHRQSYRLKGYDYSQAGLYFITICTHNRECFFGHIENNGASQVMCLNDLGKIADEFWLKIPEHFPDTALHEHVVMPNHMHGIIELVGTRRGVSETNNDTTTRTRFSVSQPDSTFGKPISGSVSVIINQYKASVKRWCNQNGHSYFKWQSRFHDHIIRDEKSYLRISEYIMNNPSRWDDDTLNLNFQKKTW